YSNNTSSTRFVIQTNNTLRLDKKKTWILGENYFYVDKQQIELGLLNELMSLDLNIKKIWNDWTFTFSVNDVLRTNVVEIEDIQQNGKCDYIKHVMYKQIAALGFVYNFGNNKVKKVREIDDANSDVNSS